MTPGDGSSFSRRVEANQRRNAAMVEKRIEHDAMVEREADKAKLAIMEWPIERARNAVNHLRSLGMFKGKTLPPKRADWPPKLCLIVLAADMLLAEKQVITPP